MARTSKKTNKKKRRRSSSSSSDDSASSEDAAAAVPRGNPPPNIQPNELAVRRAFNHIYPNIDALKIAADYREGSLIAGNIRQPGQGNLLVSIVQNYDLSRLRLFCDVCKKLYKHNSFNAHLNKCIEKNPFEENAPMIRNTVNKKRVSNHNDRKKNVSIANIVFSIFYVISLTLFVLLCNIETYKTRSSQEIPIAVNRGG